MRPFGHDLAAGAFDVQRIAQRGNVIDRHIVLNLSRMGQTDQVSCLVNQRFKHG